MNRCGHAGGVALFRAHPGPLCTIKVVHRTPRVVRTDWQGDALVQFCAHPTAPPAGQPSQPEPASLSAAPDAVGAAGTVTRAVAHDSDVLGRAVAHAESMTVSEDIEMMMTGIDSLRHAPWAK